MNWVTFHVSFHFLMMCEQLIILNSMQTQNTLSQKCLSFGTNVNIVIIFMNTQLAMAYNHKNHFILRKEEKMFQTRP